MSLPRRPPTRAVPETSRSPPGPLGAGVRLFALMARIPAAVRCRQNSSSGRILKLSFHRLLLYHPPLSGFHGLWVVIVTSRTWGCIAPLGLQAPAPQMTSCSRARCAGGRREGHRVVADVEVGPRSQQLLLFRRPRTAAPLGTARMQRAPCAARRGRAAAPAGIAVIVGARRAVKVWPEKLNPPYGCPEPSEVAHPSGDTTAVLGRTA